MTVRHYRINTTEGGHLVVAALCGAFASEEGAMTPLKGLVTCPECRKELDAWWERVSPYRNPRE